MLFLEDFGHLAEEQEFSQRHPRTLFLNAVECSMLPQILLLGAIMLIQILQTGLESRPVFLDEAAVEGLDLWL